MSNDFAEHEQRAEETKLDDLCIECGGLLEQCRCRPGCPGGWCVPCQGKQRAEKAPRTEDRKDEVRMVVQNARQFERELLCAKLETELFIETQGDDIEQAYRRGWNARARACLDELRGKR